MHPTSQQGIRSRMLCIGVLSLVIARTLSAEPVDLTQAQELYRRSGVERYFAGLDDQVTGQLEEALHRGSRHGAFEDVVLDASRTSFAAARIESGIVQSMTRNLEAEDARAALAWLRTDTGEKITRAERAAMQPGAQDGIEEYARSLGSRLPEQRIALLRRLQQALGSVDLGVSVARTMGRATIRAIARARGDEGTDTQIARFDSQSSALRRQLEQALLFTHLYMYRDLADAELIAYLEYLETAPGRAYARALNRAMLDALDTATHDFDATIATALGSPAPEP